MRTCAQCRAVSRKYIKFEDLSAGWRGFKQPAKDRDVRERASYELVFTQYESEESLMVVS